jgi:hypothetical protein
MKPVFSTENEMEFHSAWERLQAGGIPVTELATTDLAGYKVGPKTRTIYIWLDEQYEDAFKLLADPSHVVANPIDTEQFDHIESQANVEHEKSMKETSESTLNWFVGLGIAAVLAIGVYQIFK